MEHEIHLRNNKYRQWIKAGLGLGYLKEGLAPFCDDLGRRQHNDIINKIQQTKTPQPNLPCVACQITTLKPDHVRISKGICPLKQDKCNCCFPNNKRPCPNNVCGAIYDSIIQYHASIPPSPFWKNSDAQQWSTDPWSVIKCFINAPGYKDRTSAFSTDCTGLLHVIINNKYFHSHIGDNVAGPNNLFSKVRQYRNMIFHTSSMELEEKEANTYLDDMITVLQDSKELVHQPAAQQSVLKLQDLKKKDFIITTVDFDEILRQINEEMKKVLKSIEDDPTKKEYEELNKQSEEHETQIFKLNEEIKRFKKEDSPKQKQLENEKAKSAALINAASEKDLNQISECIGSNWEMLAPFLIERNSTATVEQIKDDHRQSRQRVYYLLFKWRTQTDDPSLAHLFHSMYQAGMSVTIDWNEIAYKLKVPTQDIRACRTGYQHPETRQQQASGRTGYQRPESRQQKASGRTGYQRPETRQQQASGKLPEEIRNMDARSIQIFEKALQEGKVPVRNIRVMVVGHFGVGKSTLTKRLLGMEVDISIRKPTEGIEVHTDRCKLSKDGTWLMHKPGEERFNMLGQLAKVLFKDLPKEDATGDNSAQMMKTERTEKQFARNLTDIYRVHPSVHVSVQQEKNEDTPFNSSVRKEMTNQESLSDCTRKEGETNAAKEKKDNQLKMLIANAVQNEEKGDGNVSIWDFAGQDMFYSTHQVFLCKRAVYLLITDITKDFNENVDDPWSREESTKRKVSEYIDFWLNSIHHYCGYSEKNGPPVVLIGTFADKLQGISRGTAKETLNCHFIDKVAKCHLTGETFMIDNSVEDENIVGLRKHIFDVAARQGYWEEEIPAKWVTLESIILGLKDSKIKFISKEKLQELNLALPVPLGDEELEVYLHFHHEAGNILYFSQESLKEYVIIDPQWLIDAFKSITMAGEKCSNKRKTNVAAMWRDFKNSAQLKQELIDEIWTEDDNINCFKSNKDLLLEYLEILGLIVQPHHDESNEFQAKNYFLVPMKLQNRPPKEITSSADRKDSKSSSKLCITACKTPEERFLPDVLFNKFLAYCIKKWELVYKKSMPMIFNKGAIFNLKEDNLDLNIVYYDHVIQIWVTGYSSDEISALCSELKQEIIGMLESVIRNKNNIEMFVKCCKANVFSNECMFPLVEDKDWKDRCNCGDERHGVTYRDLMQCWLEGCLARDQKESFKFDGRLVQLTEIQTESLRRSLDKNAIGSGTFGQVYRSNDSKMFGIPVAVKMITKTECGRAQKHARMEMMANRLMNPFILPLIAFAKKSIGETWLITPYLENGDLEKAIKDGNGITDKMKINMQMTRVRIALHIALAIQYIHTEIPNVRGSILHKDISSSNVVLDKNLNARLIDFGLAREKVDTSKTYSEKPGYTHPKKGDPHIKESLDYYSFGIIIRELLTSLGPAEKNKKYLQKMDINEITGGLDTKVWVDEEITKKLYNVSEMCLENYTWTIEDFETNVIKTLQKIMLKEDIDKYESQESEEKACHHCIINPLTKNSSLTGHYDNCKQKIEVCIACEKNSNLYPVTCYCGATLKSKIGSKWGALLVAGDDENPKNAAAMKRDILELERVVTSNAPRIIGMSKCNVKTVVPDETRTETNTEEMPTWTKIKEHIAHFAEDKNIDTLLMYFSCHGADKERRDPSKSFIQTNMFQLGKSSELISLEDFQNEIGKLNNVNKLILFLDRCFPPMIKFKNDQREFIQINACSEDQKAILKDEGSLFTKYVIQGLKARSETRECSKDCQHCPSFWEMRRRKEYISIRSLFDYVNDHLEHKAPLPKWHVKTTKTDIAFFTEDVVKIEFTTKDITTKDRSTTFRLPLSYLKDIVEVKNMLHNEFIGDTETHEVKIKKDIFRNDQEADDECKTLEQVMEAWVHRFPLHVSFLKKEET